MVAVQKILLDVSQEAKRVCSGVSIKRAGNRTVSQMSINMPNNNSVSTFVSQNGSSGVGVYFADTGVGGISGRMMIGGQSIPFHAQTDRNVPNAYGEIAAILKEYQAGKCKDVTQKVLSGKY